MLTLSLKFRPVKKSDGTVRQSVVPQSVSICVAWYSHGMRGGGKAFRHSKWGGRVRAWQKSFRRRSQKKRSKGEQIKNFAALSVTRFEVPCFYFDHKLQHVTPVGTE